MVKARIQVPADGEICWFDFNPIRGHEQGGKRPALVISPHEYNAKTGLCLVCPVTSRSKGYPFEVAFSAKALCGYILADHVRNLSWEKRNCRFVCRLDVDTIDEVKLKLQKLIDIKNVE
ncbi:MAG: type II toxin-antitoxin system PemK/MazF family toxin [Candidatus Vogelbacteria bacterium]|nr:type II toxin-antitoxin system PemK/MazF family toxin [Candidatus Vogelbacteria bacterium]